MHIDSKGNVTKYEITPSIIRSRKKMTYDNVNLILEDNIIPDGYEIGYNSVKEISKKINNSFYTMKGYDVDSKELYQNDLFSNEIERFLYSYE